MGDCTRRAPACSVLSEGLPVCAGGVDAAVATLRAGVVREGQHAAMLSSSTCWGFIHSSADRFSRPRLDALRPSTARTLTYSYGGSATSGSVVQWFRDNFADNERLVESLTSGGKRRISAFDLLDEHASTIQPGSNGLMVLPYFMGERSPIWDVDARGTITGLTLNHTKSHLYRGHPGIASPTRSRTISNTAAPAFQGLEEQLDRRWRRVPNPISGSRFITNVTGRPGAGYCPTAARRPTGAAVIAAYGIGNDRPPADGRLAERPSAGQGPDPRMPPPTPSTNAASEHFKRLYETHEVLLPHRHRELTSPIMRRQSLRGGTRTLAPPATCGGIRWA